MTWSGRQSQVAVMVVREVAGKGSSTTRPAQNTAESYNSSITSTNSEQSEN